MILADKIIEERKKLNLSQEELAEKLSVSRQAVSKWESTQSIPDLQKILLMSELFSVSTDYLLKDEIESETHLPTENDTDGTVRRVSMEEATEFMSVTERQSKTVAIAVFLCIVSPILLILMAGLSNGNVGNITDGEAVAIGITALFACITVAVILFIRNASQTEKFNFLSKESFETAYGVSGLIREKKATYEPTYTRFLTVGIVLCTLSPLPLILTALMNDSELSVIVMTAVLLGMVAVGVSVIVRVGTVKSGYEILLQEGDFRKDNKEKNTATTTVSTVYWCVVTAVYLMWSFLTNDWKTTWIVWAVAGILYMPVMMLTKVFDRNGDSK